MNFYSTSTGEPNPMGPVALKFQPFTVCARVVPSTGYGRRFESVRDLERLALNLYNEIEPDMVSAGITISAPFSVTPQFGNMPARITFNGFAAPVAAENISPVTPTATIIHSGSVDGEKTSVMTPYQGTQGWGDKPTAAVIARVLVLKNALLAASPTLEIIYINYNGVRFGNFPGKTGFFNLP